MPRGAVRCLAPGQSAAAARRSVLPHAEALFITCDCLVQHGRPLPAAALLQFASAPQEHAAAARALLQTRHPAGGGRCAHALADMPFAECLCSAPLLEALLDTLLNCAVPHGVCTAVRALLASLPKRMAPKAGEAPWPLLCRGHLLQLLLQLRGPADVWT